MKYFKKYFTIWWIPIVSYVVPIITFIVEKSLKSNDIIDCSFYLFLINMLGNIISSIVQIVIKKWYFIFPQIFVSAFLFFYATKFFAYGEHDFFSAGTTISKNVKCEEPPFVEGKDVGSYFEAIPKKEIASNDFKVEKARRTGNYYYYVNFQPKEKGDLYIKAYDISTNEQLSEGLINYENVKIEDLNQKFYSGNFTIYEGVGSKYCARIELWQQLNNGKQYKVNQKNYIVEGKD